MNVEILIEDGIVKDIHHDGHGCSICCSSASVMSETLKGKKVEDAKKLILEFYDKEDLAALAEKLAKDE